MAINTNRQVKKLYIDGVQMVLNTIENPTNTYAQIVNKTISQLNAEDLEGLTSFPTGGFQVGNTNLLKVTFPKSITTYNNVGNNGAFGSCTNLEEVEFAKPSSAAGTFGGPYFSTTKVAELIFPDGITTIGSPNASQWVMSPPSGGTFYYKKIVAGANVTAFGYLIAYTANASKLAVIINKDISTSEDVPTLAYNGSYAYSFPSGFKTYVKNSTAQALVQSATNWSSHSSNIFVLSKIYLDTDEKYIAADPAVTIQENLTRGYLSIEKSRDLWSEYDFYTDSAHTTPVTANDLYTQGLVLYGVLKED